MPKEAFAALGLRGGQGGVMSPERITPPGLPLE
jgi:hypothetical protein